GTKEAISHFSKAIQIQDFPIYVESVETIEETYTGEFQTFSIIRGDMGEEMAERMDTAIQHLTLIGKYSKTAAKNSTTLIEMMHTSLEKQDQMLNKQDQMLNKQDQMLGKQDEMISLQHETVDEIKGLRKDSKSYLDKEFSEIHKRLHSIENALNDAGIKIH
ncbi:acylphosphatase, partial [Methanospirillum hungatei]|uniref:acylphosphatase n=1 Tax=Methanospirillum hungatei TaxID=2203 RepID=UPI0026F0A188